MQFFLKVPHFSDKKTGRSSRPEMSIKKGLLKIPLNLQKNTRDSLFLTKFQAVDLQLY